MSESEKRVTTDNEEAKESLPRAHFMAKQPDKKSELKMMSLFLVITVAGTVWYLIPMLGWFPHAVAIPPLYESRIGFVISGVIFTVDILLKIVLLVSSHLRKWLQDRGDELTLIKNHRSWVMPILAVVMVLLVFPPFLVASSHPILFGWLMIFSSIATLASTLLHNMYTKHETHIERKERVKLITRGFLNGLYLSIIAGGVTFALSLIHVFNVQPYMNLAIEGGMTAVVLLVLYQLIEAAVSTKK